MTTSTCQSCHDPLFFTPDPDSDAGSNPDAAADESPVPDDLHLPCGCHFHWQCLIDQASSILSSLACPNCSSPLTISSAAGGSSSSSAAATGAAGNPQILTTYTNEGGVQPDLDIYPTLLEESFMAAHPEARPAKAFHTMTAEGDTQSMLALLADLARPDSDDEDEDEDHVCDGSHNHHHHHQAKDPLQTALQAQRLLTWRDPLNNHLTALHLALESQKEEAVWLLLWLGSAVATSEFPPAVVQAAQGNGVPRLLEQIAAAGAGSSSSSSSGKGSEEEVQDVRFVRDGKGRTPGDVCLELGEPWTRLVEGGLFGGW
ncbi:hypothetical protein VTJ04DRAFT_9717 [Mycothermus thermophilus]|uniref:uncharacterized protein n=1 Tax=Humicola insolens TaxID=85995 RepID=UPI0037426265